MKKIIRYVLALVLAFTSFAAPVANASEETDLNVAIIQLVSHPSLDLIREGVVEGLEANGYIEGENMTLDYQNAEGDMNLLSTISQQVVSNNPDYIFAITTPVAQAVQNETSDIPIILTGVTDPLSVNLVDSLDQPGGNISGISDYVPLDVQFELVQAITPDVKKIGLLYTTSEDNSLTEMEDAAAAAEALGFETVLEGIDSAMDMQMVAQSLVNEVDAIYVGSDNTIASAFETLVDVSDAAGIPVYTGVEVMVEQGALAGVAMSQKQIGIQAADFLQKLLDGANISETAVEYVSDLTTVVNSETAERLGLTLPEDVLGEATDLAQ